ncbi:MAG: thioesterase family protein [Eubacteriaceae bacterium]|jgi:fluoroacetyl-CoA thioesterase|nr:thioesterase family protein [Eubacteriaceae bacterium]MDD4508328.1 thioesterase family protein [Eubacteriaceae bacterium]
MEHEQGSSRLKVGMELKKDYTVTRNETAKHIGSGGVEVLATPMLVNWVENAAYEMAGLCLPDEETTVGVNINLDHMAATPVGMKVRVKVLLKEVDRKKLIYSVEAWDTVQKVAEGTHMRYVVTKTKFMGKVLQKRDQ